MSNDFDMLTCVINRGVNTGGGNGFIGNSACVSDQWGATA